MVLSVLVLFAILPRECGCLLLQPTTHHKRQSGIAFYGFPKLSRSQLLSPQARCHDQHIIVYQSRDWIDEVRDDELLESPDGPPVKPDMKYIPRNVMRQNENFVAIRQAGGKELTNDVYVREPNSQVFWFVGKIARVSDVSPVQALRRQWNMVETHAANLRPIELFPGRGMLELWLAPGDSEMEVAYNRPHVKFEKINRQMEDDNGVSVDKIKSNFIGFQGEMYQGGEQGFRTWRNDDGSPAKPEISTPDPTTVQGEGQEQLRAPSESEMVDIQKMLENKDINQVYNEQQRRAGKSIDDDDDA